MAGTRLTGTTARACPSSIATPPQWAPPMLPGCESVPCVLGGVNGPALRSAARMSWQGNGRGRRSVVEVPEVVVHSLKMPHNLPRGGAQRDDRTGVAVFTQPHPAEVIRCGTRGWKEHEIARGIGDDHRPDVGSAADTGGSVLPGLESRIG